MSLSAPLAEYLQPESDIRALRISICSFEVRALIMSIYDFEIRACINWYEKFGLLFSSDYRGTEGDMNTVCPNQ